MPISPSLADELIQIPLIDIQPLVAMQDTTGAEQAVPSQEVLAVAAQIGEACREFGFFYIVGHGVDENLQARLEQLSREFFAQDLATKMKIGMKFGGRAWRGYFPVGDELTSGKPDLKEGIYFGTELTTEHPLVKAHTPLHGPNLFPDNMPWFQQTVLEYMAVMTQLGHSLMTGIALSLGLEASYFVDRYTSEPLTLFRIFNYPSQLKSSNESYEWGVGEHTDYGVLTILKQDDAGGLQVKSKSRWIAAPSIAGSFVCNIGDMLDRMTGGLYRSTPHRVRNLASRDRLSFPFFFDPNFNVEVKPIDLGRVLEDDPSERWDQASVHQFQGTYGDYVLSKVAKVFPELQQTVL
jgi:isopenicillin N synthase-like dioxygenase